MSVIKGHKSELFTKEAVVLNLGDLGREAVRIRSAAETKAAQILADAERKATQLVRGAEAGGFEQGRASGLEQGLEEGRKQGLEEALNEARGQFEQLQTAWSDVAVQWDEQRRQLEREARYMVIEFALKLAEKLVHRVVEVDPSVIVDQASAALAHVLRPMDVVIRIHPGDRPWIERAMPELMAEFQQLEHVRLVDEQEISQGGCIVTYGQAQIDATIETQLERVVDLILLAEDTEPRDENPGISSQESQAEIRDPEEEGCQQ